MSAMPAKRTFYITLFTALGILVSFLLHGVIEIACISLLLKDFPRYGLGLSWEVWRAIHHAGAAALLIAGIILGFSQGRRWWRIMYERGR